MSETSRTFPDGFTWGAAAASYQIEGAARDDGKGLSVWDMMCRQPGKIEGGDAGESACDHYRRYREDVELMAEIGLQAYRFSVSWPRVLPEGAGRVNEAGLAFYDRLVDALLEHGIEPWLTLFHWDYPYELFLRGGWLNQDSPKWFAEYAEVVVERLSDRVRHWIPQNEPQCFIHLGHLDGVHAPGLKLGIEEVLLAAHHSLLAHGMAVQAIRAGAKSPPVVGGAPVGFPKIPHTGAPEDIEAARTAMFSMDAPGFWNNAWFGDAMVFGRYPEDGVAMFGEAMPEIREGDMETIGQPLDFFGVNIYFGDRVRAGADGRPETVPPEAGAPRTTMGWVAEPESLYWGPRLLHERYQLPIVITENGMANTDWVQSDGRVQDPQRIDFLARYLREYRRAIADGVEAKGYFLWSILDNFEWSYGYAKRFGIVHVDYATGKRTPKDSAAWYREVIRSNGEKI